jgi:hypothetical protein
MARTIEVIKQQMIDELATQSDLAALNSVSNTAIYNLWLYIQAVIIHYFEVLQDTFKGEVQTIIDSNQYGTKQWWFNQAKAFQFGDILLFINNVYKYATIDDSKKIVKYCSVTDNGGKVQIKVAKQSGSIPVVLTIDEVNGMVDYINDIKPAGTDVTIQSLAADLVKVQLNVYYNANLGLDNIKLSVEAAITNFFASIQFDGILYRNKLIDAIQAVPGVVNDQVEVLVLEVKSSGQPYVAVSSRFSALSGYYQIDPSFPLTTQINYIT